jgi:hypothetical protein
MGLTIKEVNAVRRETFTPLKHSDKASKSSGILIERVLNVNRSIAAFHTSDMELYPASFARTPLSCGMFSLISFNISGGRVSIADFVSL